MTGVDRAGLRDDLARARDVVGRLHEAQRHEVHAEREAEPQIVDVLLGQRRRRQGDARRVDALVPAERPAVDHDDVAGPPRDRPTTSQLDPPIVEQQAIAGLRRTHQLGVGREDAARAGTARALAEDQRLVLPSSGSGRSPASGPVRIFGPLRSCMMATCRPACDAISRMRAKLSACDCVGAVREVEPEHVDAGGDERVEHVAARAGGTDGGDDLGVAHHAGSAFSVRSGRRFEFSRSISSDAER